MKVSFAQSWTDWSTDWTAGLAGQDGRMTHLITHSGEKSNKSVTVTKPCMLSGKQFEDTFENPTNRQPVVKVSQVGVIGRQIGASAVLARMKGPPLPNTKSQVFTSDFTLDR